MHSMHTCKLEQHSALNTWLAYSMHDRQAWGSWGYPLKTSTILMFTEQPWLVHLYCATRVYMLFVHSTVVLEQGRVHQEVSPGNTRE